MRGHGQSFNSNDTLDIKINGLQMGTHLFHFERITCHAITQSQKQQNNNNVLASFRWTDVGFRALADLPHPDPGGDWDPEAAEPNLLRKRSALTLTANLTAKGAGP